MKNTGKNIIYAKIANITKYQNRKNKKLKN